MPWFPRPSFALLRRRLGGVAAAVAVSLIAVSAVIAAPPAHAAAVADRLSVGQVLHAGDSLQGGQYSLVLQGDGNLVVYGNGRALWATMTIGPVGSTSNSTLVLQADGNLVLYSGAGRPLWYTGTWGTGAGNQLIMQADGNLVLYAPSRPLWATWMPGADRLTAGGVLQAGQYIHSSNGYRLIMQNDGNLVLYDPAGTPKWNTNTWRYGSGVAAVLQGDSNLVLYQRGRAIWASNTVGNAKVIALVVATNGGLTLAADGNPRWAQNVPPGASGYPFDMAVCVDTGQINGVCPSLSWTYNGQSFDQWGYTFRNCTSYVAWWLSTHGGTNFDHLGNGADWGLRAASRTDTTPAVGAVAWWKATPANAYGHVAVVTGINSDGSVSIAQYNVANMGSYSVVARAWPDGFIHVGAH